MYEVLTEKKIITLHKKNKFYTHFNLKTYKNVFIELTFKKVLSMTRGMKTSKESFDKILHY